jgi:hypothetical protein
MLAARDIFLTGEAGGFGPLRFGTIRRPYDDVLSAWSASSTILTSSNLNRAMLAESTGRRAWQRQRSMWWMPFGGSINN